MNIHCRLSVHSEEVNNIFNPNWFSRSIYKIVAETDDHTLFKATSYGGLMSKAYVLIGENGTPLDARFEIEEDSIVIHSRGGSKKSSATNSDYSKSLRLLLERLHSSNIRLKTAWVDSSSVQGMPLAARTILSASESELSASDNRGGALDKSLSFETILNPASFRSLNDSVSTPAAK